LISELLRGMRLSGVKYRRIEASAPFGVAFSHAPGKARFLKKLQEASLSPWKK
jgi:hypothetical protein